MRDFKEVDSSYAESTVLRCFELVAVDGSIAFTTVSAVHHEKMKIVHKRMELILDVHYRCQNVLR